MHRAVNPLPIFYSETASSRPIRPLAIPDVRGSALWFAHSVMASLHHDASDRRNAYRRTWGDLKKGAITYVKRRWTLSGG
jgi:hypothetical protein